MDQTAHWMADCVDVDEWPDNPVATPELAAQQFLEIGTDNDHCWHAWDDLQRGGTTTVLVRRWDATTELITDPEHWHDGYEPGSEWFKRTTQTVAVVVTLAFLATKKP